MNMDARVTRAANNLVRDQAAAFGDNARRGIARSVGQGDGIAKVRLMR